VQDIVKDFKDIKFVPGRYFMWSPLARTLTYDVKTADTNRGKMGMLHELGHARLGHRIYKYDMELLNMEMDAWDFARQMAPKYGVKMDEEHIKRAISTYDYWLSKRATCPDCQNFSLQKDRDYYGCFACGSKWQVNWRKDRRVTRTVVERWQHLGHIHTDASPKTS
jgi:hypothetical protein